MSKSSVESKNALPNKKPVLAITRTGAFWFKSLQDCCLAYNIRSRAYLVRMIRTGQVAPDGFTTFEEPLDGVIYDGMTDSDIEVVKSGENCCSMTGGIE